MKIIWTDLGVDRVYEIAAYIAKDNSAAAIKWVEKLFKRVEDLSLFEKSSRKVPETRNPKLREIIFGNYRIVYKIEKDTIYVLTVRHFKQILPLEELK